MNDAYKLYLAAERCIDYAPRIERRLYRKALLRDGLQALLVLVVFILALSLVR